jgi:hypothetical protein
MKAGAMTYPELLFMYPIPKSFWQREDKKMKGKTFTNLAIQIHPNRLWTQVSMIILCMVIVRLEGLLIVE